MWSDISSQTSGKQLHNTGSYTNKDCSPVELSHQDKLLNISGTKRSSLLRSLQSLDRGDADTVQASFKEFWNTLCFPTFGLSHCKQYTYIFDFNTSDIPGMVETSRPLLTGFTPHLGTSCFLFHVPSMPRSLSNSAFKLSLNLCMC